MSLVFWKSRIIYILSLAFSLTVIAVAIFAPRVPLFSFLEWAENVPFPFSVLLVVIISILPYLFLFFLSSFLSHSILKNTVFVSERM